MPRKPPPSRTSQPNNPSPAPPLITDLDRVAALADARREDTRAFAHYVELMWDREGRTDGELDALVEAIAAGVIPRIDCTACANCCRSVPVGLVPGDVPPLAAALGLPEQEVIACYVDRRAGARQGEWGILRGAPCPLLDGGRCSVYAYRPGSCRAYPAFTPDFRYLLLPIARGAGLCPIIFNVIERLKHRLGWSGGARAVF